MGIYERKIKKSKKHAFNQVKRVKFKKKERKHDLDLAIAKKKESVKILLFSLINSRLRLVEE